MNTTDKIMAMADEYMRRPLVDSRDGSTTRNAMRTEIEALVRDAERLDHLQKNGSTVDLVPGDVSFYPMRFRVGGWHSSVNESIRAAIDTAMQEKQS